MTEEFLYMLLSKRTSEQRSMISDHTLMERSSWIRRGGSMVLGSAGWVCQGYCGWESGETVGGRFRTVTGVTCGVKALFWVVFMSSGQRTREHCWNTEKWSLEIK